MSLRFLIVEGNTHDTREAYRKALGATPAESYGRLMASLAGGAHFDILRAADADGTLPTGARLSDYDAAILTGSALHLWQREPESLRQVEVAREIFRAGIPFFGSCWGLQVATVAAGGDVHKNPRGREFGIARRIMPNAAGAAHPLLEGRGCVFDAPCTHLDEVARLPSDSTLLASNAISQVQAAEIRHEGGTFWGVQYHPEFSFSTLAYLIERRTVNLIDEGFLADENQARTMAADLRQLDREPGSRQIAWRHGLERDVTDTVERVTELRNFLEARVKPHAIARAA
ncbi:MAG TPA: type 1 glutamine amidotransferase [Rhabdaerophilum sp.]|nr:type 1 glutamine amidotransferase [Rhabdaerophilum sp.]